MATLYRRDSRKVLATLIRLLGDFDLAEEAVQDAFKAAVEQWPRDGIPANPVPWLVSAGRFKAIDGIRRRARFDPLEGDVADRVEAVADSAARWDEGEEIGDDSLRLIFTCCHPALSADAQVALTLREVSRPDHRGDRERLPDAAGDAGAAHRPRQGQDPRRAHSVQGARSRPSSRAGSRASCA